MLKLKIASPLRVEYDGEVESVAVPGTAGRFEILPGHAPIVSSLDKGVVAYRPAGSGAVELPVHGGFVEVKRDNVSLCVEVDEESKG